MLPHTMKSIRMSNMPPFIPVPADDTLEDESGLDGGEENEGSLAGQESKADVSSVDSSQFLNKKDQFRKYLIKTGFKHAIIRSFVALYEDKQKPDEPMAWILGFMGQGLPTPQELEKHRSQAKEFREKIERLQQENFELRLRIDERDRHLAKPKTLAEQELSRMIDELTESGAFAPLPEMGEEIINVT